MKKAFFSLVLVMSIGLVFSLKSKDAQYDQVAQTIQITPNVAWAVDELTGSEAAAGVSGTSAAIGAYQTVRVMATGAKWGARIGKFAGPWGCLAGVVVGAL